MKMELEMYEVNLPVYLQEDLNILKASDPQTCISYDVYWDALYSSISSAYVDDDITLEQALYLRGKYLGLVKEDGNGFD